MKILIVEDEEHIADGLRFNLEAEGYEVEIAGDGETALDLLQGSGFDAIVLDIMLPGIDGFEVARTIRARADYTPILMLTARGRPEDVLSGFEAGTDDYLPKPFDLNIFFARIKGLLRRQEWTKKQASPATDRFVVNGKTIDFENLEVATDEGVTHLTLMEMKLLRFLIENEGRPVVRTRRELGRRVGGGPDRSAALRFVWFAWLDSQANAVVGLARLRKVGGDLEG
jgi:DNA-binding response OmpR family regulator